MTIAQRLTRPRFLTGDLPELGRDVLTFLSARAREHPDGFPVQFGLIRELLLNRPSDIEELLVEHHRDFVKSRAYRLMRRVGGHGLFTSEGQLWRTQRQLIQPAFHQDRIRRYADLMVAYAERTVARWSDGEVRRTDEDMRHLTLEIVAKCLFDEDATSDEAEVGRAVDEVRAGLMAILSSMQLLLPEFVPTPSNLRLRAATRRLDSIVYRIVRERRAGGRDAGDVLSMLLAARGEDGVAMSDEQVRDEVMTLYLAGHETSAVALTWAWYLLASHPQAEAELREELATTLAGRPPRADDVGRLRYTEAVGYEALRLYPPIVLLARQAIRDVEIGGQRIARGTTVLVSPYLLHRDARWFVEPDAFRPERWLDDLAERLPRFAYFPFGAGPRRCIGASFAVMELTLLLATIAQRTRLALVDSAPVVPRAALTLRPRDGLRMRVEFATV